MEIHHFSWENPLFLWPCSIATLNYQRVPFNWQRTTIGIHILCTLVFSGLCVNVDLNSKLDINNHKHYMLLTPKVALREKQEPKPNDLSSYS